MKKKIFKIIIVIILLVISIMLGRNTKEDEIYEEVLPEVSKNLLSMMLEDGNGEYILEKRDSWPSKEDGYVFNKKLSKCQNGSKVTWDDENNVVIFEGTSIDKCHVYFDIYSGVTLADYVKSFYTSVQGENGIYYHTSSLENGAGDNSYRYAGTNPNNFVCFGSDADVCPNDNLYRIIGVFGDQVKLIKYDYATSELLGIDGDYSAICSSNTNCNNGTNNGVNSKDKIGAYWWNYNNASTTYSATSYYNLWGYSKLNTVNLNINYITYLNNVNTKWANKIADTTWIIGGNTYDNIIGSNSLIAYTNEIINPSNDIATTYNAKIGLMYVSDYYYGAPSTYWTYAGYNSSDSSKDYRVATIDNWMYMGLLEWTITRASNDNGRVFYIYNNGFVYYAYAYTVDWAWAVRPVFYLNADVLVEGNHQGTSSDPYRIN